jgi:hypothetical protein
VCVKYLDSSLVFQLLHAPLLCIQLLNAILLGKLGHHAPPELLFLSLCKKQG